MFKVALSSLIWTVLFTDDIVPKMVSLRGQSAKLSTGNASINGGRPNHLEQQWEILLKILGEVQRILIDETSYDRSSYVVGKGQDVKSMSKVSLVPAEDSALISADVLPTAMDGAPEASSEEEPSKEDSPADPPGEGVSAAEESAPHVTQRATGQRSSLASSGPWARYRPWASFSKRAWPGVRTY
jgi:hypothetical protein